MKQIRWSHWEAGVGLVDYGEMTARDVAPTLRRFERRAVTVLKETAADHVLYGLKIYGGADDTLKTVQFYVWPMDDDEFYRLPAKLNGSVVYALHRR